MWTERFAACFTATDINNASGPKTRVYIHTYVDAYIHAYKQSIRSKEADMLFGTRHIHTYIHTYTHTIASQALTNRPGRNLIACVCEGT